MTKMTYFIEIFYIFLLLPFIIKSAPPNPGITSSVDTSGKGDPCSFKGTDYSISWYYDKETTNVVFEYDSPVKTGKWWSSIGIGDNMSDMDIAVIYVDDGNVVDVIDHYSSDYVPPIKDENQDWKLVKTSNEVFNGRTKYVVERKMNTGDDKKDKTMDGCVLFQFGVNLAEYGVKNGVLKIKKHENWPDLYKACDLKEKCVKKSLVIEKAADAAVISIPQETLIHENKKSSLTSSGPSKCKSAGLKYTSHWNYNKSNDSIEFVLNFETSPEKSWSAITFGTSAKRDAFILFTDNRKIVDTGDYVLKNFSELKKDRQQDWEIIYSKTDEDTNFAKIKMSRKLVTTDKKRDRPFDNCVNIQFGINMGSYEIKENQTYKLTRNNDPSEAVMMCNIKELCVADSGSEIAKDAAPEGIKITENDISEIVPPQNITSQFPENEENAIKIHKRVEEIANNNNITTNNTQTLTVETTTTLLQTSSPVITDNTSTTSPSNIPESENEDTISQSPSTLLQSLSTPPSEILTETGSGIEISAKNSNIQTTLLQSSPEASTSFGDLKNEEITITTTEVPTNTTIPENLTASTPTFTTSLNNITTPSIINQETTTSTIVPLTQSAELDTSIVTTNNIQFNSINETTTTSTTVVPGNESKEFDNSNESGDLTTKLQETSQVPSTTTVTIANPIDTKQQQNNTTIINIPQESITTTTVPLINDVTNTTTSVNIDTTTISQTTTTTTIINNNDKTINQSIPNTSTPETINKFLESHESDNSKENKEIINQINNDNGKKNNTCGNDHKDLSICDSYMNEYLNRVEVWAKQRNDTLDNQLWKACSLLKKVPHVPTLCCHIFNYKCGSHVTRPPTTTTTVSSLV